MFRGAEATDTYAQRLDADGNPMWTINGVLVIADDDDSWIASDGNGGAIIMSYYGYVNRVDSEGNLLWGDADNPVTYSIGDPWAPKIVSDGEGGAILTWMEDDDTAVQRINQDGEKLWGVSGNPVLLSGTVNPSCPRLVPSGDGGAIVIWIDSTEYTLWAQKIDGDGSTVWTDGGVLVSSEDSFGGDTIDLASDGHGGAFITWEDDDDETLWAKGIQADGDFMWPGAVRLSAVEILMTQPSTRARPTKTAKAGSLQDGRATMGTLRSSAVMRMGTFSGGMEERCYPMLQTSVTGRG